MPLYEYQCESCDHRFEVIQKYSDAPIAVCPKCAGPVQKLLSSPAIQFKGSGFYLTDYGRGGKRDSAAGAAGKSDGKSDGKSEGKAEGKAEGGKSEGGKSESTSSKSDSGSGSSSSESKPAASTPSKE